MSIDFIQVCDIILSVFLVILFWLMLDYTCMDDVELQSRAVSGNRAAEEELVVRYMRLVRACARPLFLAGGDSEDLIQEGMFGLLSAIRSFSSDSGSSFKTFAEHCIKMRLYSAVKTASRLKHFPLNDGMSLEQLSENPSTELSAFPESFRRGPEDLVLARESKKELYRAFSDCLSKFEKQVLNLYLEGLSYQEIAASLGKEKKSIDNAVQRIRQKMARNHNFGEISWS